MHYSIMSKAPFLDPLTSDVFVSNVARESHGTDPLSNPLPHPHSPPRQQQEQEQEQQQRSSLTKAVPHWKGDTKQPLRSHSAAVPSSTRTASKDRPAHVPPTASRFDKPKIVGGIVDPLSSSPPLDTSSYQPHTHGPTSTSRATNASDSPVFSSRTAASDSPILSSRTAASGSPVLSSRTTTSGSPILSSRTTASGSPILSSRTTAAGPAIISTQPSPRRPGSAYPQPHSEPRALSSPIARPSSVVHTAPLTTPRQPPNYINASSNPNRNTIASFPAASSTDRHRTHPASEPNSSLPSPATSNASLPQNQYHGNSQDDGMPVTPPSPRIRRRDLQYDEQRVDASRIKAPLYLHITVPDTDRRAKDGMFVLNVQTNIPRYRRHSYQNVTRSYLEFVRLREHLVAEHPETIVPVLPPERSLISLSDIEAIRTFLNRISKHPILSHDYELQMFIESEFGFLPQQQHYHNPTSRSRNSFGRFLNFGVTKRFSYGSSSGGETDDEFDEERTAASKAETKLQTVIKCLDKEIKTRRDYSSKELELAGLASAWANTEEDRDFSRTFKLLFKPLDGIAKASKAQVGGDTAVLAGFLEYKLQHVQTLNQTLDYQQSVVSEYEAAVKSTENKRKIMERLRSSTSINPDKVTDSIDDLDDAIMLEGNMKTRMDQVIETVQKELVEYRRQSTEDLFRALQLYAQRQISFEKAKLEELLMVGGDRFTDSMYTPNLPLPCPTKKAGAVSERDDDDDNSSE